MACVCFSSKIYMFLWSYDFNGATGPRRHASSIQNRCNAATGRPLPLRFSMRLVQVVELVIEDGGAGVGDAALRFAVEEFFTAGFGFGCLLRNQPICNRIEHWRWKSSIF